MRLSDALDDAAAGYGEQAAAAIHEQQPECAERAGMIAGHLRRLAFTHRTAAAYQGRPAPDPKQREDPDSAATA